MRYSGEPFTLDRVASATEPGLCPICQKRWARGDEIGFIEFLSNGEKDWTRTHADCAEESPNRILNPVAPEPDSEVWRRLTQKQFLAFVHTHPSGEYRFDITANQDIGRYEVRSLSSNQIQIDT
jgi:hypothetical protein